ncbi:MAG: hypothetical protein M0R03_20275 [Novosphingobium sp.]|nr:hypothetical protein [Novosphingobium sp.]
MTLRPRQVGAFVPVPDEGRDWVETPQTKQQSSKRQILTLSVRIVDTSTLMPAYAATASLPRFKGAPGKAAPRLAAAALEPLQ